MESEKRRPRRASRSQFNTTVASWFKTGRGNEKAATLVTRNGDMFIPTGYVDDRGSRIVIKNGTPTIGKDNKQDNPPSYNYFYELMVDGILQPAKSTRTHDQQGAIEFLAQQTAVLLEAQRKLLVSGGRRPPSVDNNFRIIDCIDAWIECEKPIVEKELKRDLTEHEFKRKFVYPFSRIREYFWMEELKVEEYDDLAATEFEAWLETCDCGLETRRSILSRLMTAIKYCHKRGYCPKLRAEWLPKPQDPDLIGKYFDPYELRLLYEAAEKRASKRDDYRMLLFFLLGMFTGARLGRILELQWQSIDLEYGTLRFNGDGPTPTNKGRAHNMMITVLGELLIKLHEQRQPDPEDHVLLNQYGVPYDSQKASHVTGSLRRLAKEAGVALNGRTFKHFRKTSLSMLDRDEHLTEKHRKLFGAHSPGGGKDKIDRHYLNMGLLIEDLKPARMACERMWLTIAESTKEYEPERWQPLTADQVTNSEQALV